MTQCRDRRSSARSRWVPSRRRPLSRHPQAEMRLLGGPWSLQPSLRGGGQLPARPWCPPDALLVSWGCPVAVPWSWGTSGTWLLGSPSPASRQCWGRGCPAAAAPLFPQKFDRAGVLRLDTAEMSLLNPLAPPALQLWDVGAPAGLLGLSGSSQPVALPGAEPPHPGCRRRALTSRPPSRLQPPGLPLGISPSTAALRCPGPGGTFPAPAHGTAPQPSPRLCR